MNRNDIRKIISRIKISDRHSTAYELVINHEHNLFACSPIIVSYKTLFADSLLVDTHNLVLLSCSVFGVVWM